MNKSVSYLWRVLALVCLIGVIFFGAWWHLATMAVCLLFSYLSRPNLADE